MRQQRFGRLMQLPAAAPQPRQAASAARVAAELPQATLAAVAYLLGAVMQAAAALPMLRVVEAAMLVGAPAAITAAADTTKIQGPTNYPAAEAHNSAALSCPRAQQTGSLSTMIRRRMSSLLTGILPLLVVLCLAPARPHPRRRP